MKKITFLVVLVLLIFASGCGVHYGSPKILGQSGNDGKIVYFPQQWVDIQIANLDSTATAEVFLSGGVESVVPIAVDGTTRVMVSNEPLAVLKPGGFTTVRLGSRESFCAENIRSYHHIRYNPPEVLFFIRGVGRGGEFVGGDTKKFVIFQRGDHCTGAVRSLEIKRFR